MRPKAKAKLLRLKKRVGFSAAPEPTVQSDEDDIHLSDDDMALLNEYGATSTFLTRLDANGLQKQSKKSAKVTAVKRVEPALDEQDDDYLLQRGSDDDEEEGEEDDEVDYESSRRELKEEWKQKELKPSRLPTIGVDGKVSRVEDADAATKSSALPSVSLALAKQKAAARKQTEVDKEAKTAEKQEIPKSEQISEQPKKLSRLETRVQVQEQFAALSSTVLENPEENIGALKTIRDIGNTKDSLALKLCLLSQLAIFKDIVPGYRIRPLTDVEKEQKISKEVKKLRMFEEGVLANYQAFLQQLDGAIRYHLGKKTAIKQGGLPDPSVAVVAAKCMAELLTTLTHFNFRTNLLSAVVSFMSTKQPPEIGVICCNSIKVVFENDVNGESSLDALKLISKLVKNTDCKVNEEVIKTFLHLRLKDELPHANDSAESRKRKNDKIHLSKKTRKLDKKYKEIQLELKEAEAEYDVEDRQKKHTETLKHVFATYFRILKNAESSPLLPAVLEGLSRYAHLINMDFFNDIITVLKKITQDQFQKIEDGLTDGSSTRSGLHCIIAAFQLLTGQGEAINIDLKDFNTSLYSELLRLPMNADYASARRVGDAFTVTTTVEHKADTRSRSEVELALMGFDLLFCRKNQVPIARAAAFLKRLATVSLHMSANATLACLSMLRAILIKHPRLQQLLATDEQLGSGIYKPFLNDPELCNPFGTNLWELSIMLNHFHPTVRVLAKHVASTNSTTAASSNAVSNYRPLPSNLNIAPLDMLWKFDHLSHASKPTFTLFPKASIQANVVSALKRKAERGLKVVDGPSVVDESDFMREIETVFIRASAEMAGDESGDVENSGDPVLDRLMVRERKLRKMADLARVATLDLLDEEGDEDVPEEEEDDDAAFDESYNDDGEDRWDPLMKRGKRSNGARRAEEFLASIGAPKRGNGPNTR